MIGRLPAGIEAVVFDVGETLIDETRAWTERAHEVGVTPFTLMATLGALIDRRRDHREVWPLLGVDPPTSGARFRPDDLYPDALPCLAAAKVAGYVVGIAGNQPDDAERALARLGVDVEFVASSARWGVAKPSPAFFQRVTEEAGVTAGSIAYVGDRLDNDVMPARAAGMFTVLLRRGPWGTLHAGWPEAGDADLRIDGLDELATYFRGGPPRVGHTRDD
ncbi:HAD family hydrolase [Arthrobacter sp.]|uniref:HAD family hydrolase n=1 Tax=Arthrobacter sp. TaxID=1667 RepID=UPI003A8FAB65